MFMKKIIPFKKDINFKTNISEITSISLEHQLSINNLDISGEFIISGDYKISDKSTTVDSFEFNLPFNFLLDEYYDTSKSVVDIDDFYYEIIDERVLSVSIDLCVDKLEEILIKNEIPNLEEKKDIIEELYEEQNCDVFSNDYHVLNQKSVNDSGKSLDNIRCIEADDILPGEKGIDMMDEKTNDDVIINKDEIKEEVNDKINSLFSNVGDSSIYVSYNVYIIREGDTVDSIIEKYGTCEEELKKYNNLSDLKLGDKIIIPAK